MIDRTMDGFGLYPQRLIADSAYGSAPMPLAWLVEGEDDQKSIQWSDFPTNGIEPHIPVFDRSKRTDGTFSREDFAYDRPADVYVCPGAKVLRQRQRFHPMLHPLVDDNGMLRYRASKLDCSTCAL
jgi:hypothetical protein